MRNLLIGDLRSLNDNKGSITVAFSLFLTLMFLALTVSVDYARALAVSQKITLALDAAALSGAKLLDADGKTDNDIKQRALDYFNAELVRIGNKNAKFDPMVPVVNRASSTVTTSVRGVVNTYFGKVAGFSTIPVSKTATVTYKMRRIELSMALDVTGSMADIPTGDTKMKIESLRTAAGSLIDTIYGNAINETNIRIAIAPYSSSVNTGSFASQVMAGPATSGCVVERAGAQTTTDAPATGSNVLPPVPTGSFCPIATISPLRGRSAQSDLKTRINNFVPNGSTAGHIGTAWAWYMVSPGWGSVFGTTSAPEPYSPDVIKNVVIMTDGLFNTAYLSGYPAGSQSASTESYTEFSALCTGMKAKGIRVYTVLFGVPDATAQANMQACASSSATFFSAANGSQLEASFNAIASQLNNMRLSR
jgi:Flp pilus assembly protein TadG